MSRGGRIVVALVLAAALAAGVTVVALSGDDDGGGGASVALPEGCEEVATPDPKEVELEKPDLAGAAPADATATVTTSCGAFEIALDAETSPRTVASFVHMAEEGLYEDTTFHRIVPGFVIQGGDPQGSGTGGPGYFVDEPPPRGVAYTQGVVAMAKTQAEPPGRSGSQFFVVTAPDAALPPVYAVLGEVSEGFETVERIEELGDETSPEGTPVAPVVIETVTINGA